MSFQSEEVSNNKNELSECKDNHNNVKPVSDYFWRLVISRYWDVITGIIFKRITCISIDISCYFDYSSFSKAIPLHNWWQEACSLSRCKWIDVLMDLEINTHLFYFIEFFLQFRSILIEWSKRCIGDIVTFLDMIVVCESVHH